ncbi:hypothetical protein ABBQ38_007508 [Trebouxia sp. C0009 RCD-2024]
MYPFMPPVTMPQGYFASPGETQAACRRSGWKHEVAKRPKLQNWYTALRPNSPHDTKTEQRRQPSWPACSTELDTITALAEAPLKYFPKAMDDRVLCSTTDDTSLASSGALIYNGELSVVL